MKKGFTKSAPECIINIERYEDYFIVYGEEGTEFSWELKAKRFGRENIRLEQKTEKEKVDEFSLLESSKEIAINNLQFVENGLEDELLDMLEVI